MSRSFFCSQLYAAPHSAPAPAPVTRPVLDALCEQFALWRCGVPRSTAPDGIRTGFAALDALLPDGGWPGAALTELLLAQTAIGELSLLMPALAALSQHKGIVLIAPPFIPYAPAFVAAGIDLRRLVVIPHTAQRDALGCAELALRSGACGAVVCWEKELLKPELLKPEMKKSDMTKAGRAPGSSDAPGRGIGALALRRLHLAADRGRTPVLLFRDAAQAVQPSPAALRIRLDPVQQQLRLTLFKRRGLFGQAQLVLDPYPSLLRDEIDAALPQPVVPSALPVAPSLEPLWKQLQARRTTASVLAATNTAAAASLE